MIPRPRRLKRVTLELSLKAFVDLSEAGVEAICSTIWLNWRHLIGRADEVALLLWVGCGDEILTWSGDLADPLPCAQGIGFHNLQYEGAYDPQVEHYPRNAARPYRDDPPAVRYADLKRIIAALRRSGQQQVGKQPLIGATIDPGPEFVDSPWRYERHREVLQIKRPLLPYPMHFLTHQAALEADERPYAGFPAGIPGGTRFGTFLGRQFQAARERLGFDYLWLSNGLGYSHHPWISRGDLFDGSSFHSGRAGEQRELASRFWRDLRAETDAAIEVRGTNFSVGMDLATDGCSHADITAIGRLQRPPCNPPWGSRALGLEMAAYLSRLAKTPTGRLPFRFYLNDPWFVSTPWYDYYAQEPFDVYVPMSAARMTAEGGVQTPTDLSLLTIDTSRGELPADEAAEFTPHMLAALDSAPDAPGPIVWVYPFDEYEAALKGEPELLSCAFAHDWFACRAVEAGLPLNTVCASDVFVKLHEAGLLGEAVYVAPVPAGDWAYGRAVVEHVRAGGKVLLYGPTDRAPAALLEALAIRHETPIEGELRWHCTLPTDRFQRAPAGPEGVDPSEAVVGLVGDSAVPAGSADGQVPLIHRAIVSGGGIREVCDDAEAVCATAADGDRRRAYAVVRRLPQWHGGQLAWIRSTVGFDPATRHLEAAWDRPGRAVQVAEVARHLLGRFGWQIVQDRLDESVRPACVFLSRRAGAWYVTGHKPDTSVRFWLRTPDGAPAYEECETPIAAGLAGECFGKSFHKLVRAFVEMPDGIVAVKRLPVPVGRCDHFSIAGLVGADVTIYADPSAGPLEAVSVRANLWTDPIACERDAARCVIRVRDFTGTLYAAW